VSASLRALLPEFFPVADYFVREVGRVGLQPRVTSTLRTSAEQKRLYDRYLAGLQQFPVAPPGTSAHEYGYAFDLVVSPFEALQDLGAAWRDMGGKWGPRDPVHFEYPGFVPPSAPPVVSSGNLVARAVQAIADLPWWISMFLPMELMTTPADEEGKLAWARSVMNWINTH